MTTETNIALPATPYAIRAYDKSAIPAVLELTRTTLGDSGAVRKTEDFWHWKHEQNPFGSSYGLYAWDETAAQMAGLRVLMRWRFADAAGNQFRGARAVDTATHPNYQRQGIFSTLTKHAVQDLTQEGTDLIFNTPNTKSMPGYLKMGWHLVAKWPLYLRPLRPMRMAARRLGIASPSPDITFADFFRPAVMPWSVFAERYGDQAAALISQWEAQRRHVGLRTVRDWDYLQWRYGEHPHIQYGVYTLGYPEQPSKLAGFAILRPNIRNKWQEVVLAEIFLGKLGSKETGGFLRLLANEVKSDYLIAHFGPKTLEHALLRAAGYLAAPRQGISFTVRPLQGNTVDFTQPSAWDLSLGDLEIF